MDEFDNIDELLDSASDSEVPTDDILSADDDSQSAESADDMQSAEGAESANNADNNQPSTSSGRRTQKLSVNLRQSKVKVNFQQCRISEALEVQEVGPEDDLDMSVTEEDNTPLAPSLLSGGGNSETSSPNEEVG